LSVCISPFVTIFFFVHFLSLWKPAAKIVVFDQNEITGAVFKDFIQPLAPINNIFGELFKPA